jgi:hypothetical protein
MINTTPYPLSVLATSLYIGSYAPCYLLPSYPYLYRVAPLLTVQFPLYFLIVPVFAQPAQKLDRYHTSGHPHKRFVVRWDPALEEVQVGYAPPCVVPVGAGGSREIVSVE